MYCVPDQPLPSVFLALGSNLGDRAAYLHAAVAALRQHPAVQLVAVSPVYESAAHVLSGQEQPDYLNAVVWLHTTLTPETLLDLCRRLEAAAGRQRTIRWAPRTLDLDVLAWDDLVRYDERLTLPHPRLAVRRFVLQPWADLAPDFYVPAPFCATVAELLHRCPDRAPLRRTGVSLKTR
ncbi:2-amino-4-hydroxy-6-hydroxymethyldihydropteridine diphosphokinase [Rhodothermus profundi]|uniref:2-amino-4-hydroxy-6-hydroxymethyldihydropteridine pyrophosphokinase n=1 Tax=Rhodothermus profundi TaxID=633813 RepID=A0A1M6PQD4_9BACT|nr:2-amino-4-hydroxy-6-hydroxymethyldihydropteridine diphosphokinase [Rhodothermus profundi]SHK10068.1 2-amino-4-hydroxy-6-hydroxymethyldihydropteridinediphosphokinase [Rhodothermus profundi]